MGKIERAFKDGVFNTDNWNDPVMNGLRFVAKKFCTTVSNGDQNTSLIPVHDVDDVDFILLSWYKNRGRTEGAWEVYENVMRPLTKDVAMKCFGDFINRSKNA